jgi:hypothetical protein
MPEAVKRAPTKVDLEDRGAASSLEARNAAGDVTDRHALESTAGPGTSSILRRNAKGTGGGTSPSPEAAAIARAELAASDGRLVRMISDFCRVRLTPLIPPLETERLRNYLVGLIQSREQPPRNGKAYALAEMAIAAGTPSITLDPVASQLRHALDAIVRVLKDLPPPPTPHPREQRRRRRPSDRPSKKRPKDQANTATARPNRTRAPSSSTSIPDVEYLESQSETTIEPGHALPKRGRPRRPVVRFPQPLWSALEEPSTFREALRMQMQRHGDSPASLYRAMQAAGVPIGRWTIDFWVRGRRAPRSLVSLRVLHLIERRYGLAEGYFSERFPNRNRAASGHKIVGIGSSERRRLAWHLPDDFDERSLDEQERILEWVRTNIVSGSTEYRRFHAATIKQRYALRFESDGSDPESPDDFDVQDPDIAPGVREAPPNLCEEMLRLVQFKTSTLAAAGFMRSGTWGEETATQKLQHLGLMFGALAAPPSGAVRGRGIPVESLTLAMLVIPAVWDWYVQWRERRRGFYTGWEVNMLNFGLALTRTETGWLRQCPDLADKLTPIAGLIDEADVRRVRSDWSAACDALHKHGLARVKEIQRVAKVHRDPFEAILPILEADSPVGEYRKIADEILGRIPDERRYPQAAAEAVRSFLLLRLGMHLGIRQKNMRQLLFRRRDEPPSSERYLADRRRGEIRWSTRDGGWEVVIPANAFKNSGSSYFGGKPFRLLLPDLASLYRMVDSYLDRHRRVLLGRAADPGTFFVKTMKATSRSGEYDQTTFYEAWRLTIQRYGIRNPHTGRGAIEGLLPHGPHNVRDILATHILKVTGSFEQASYAIQDTPATVAQHYGRFLPQDKAALAAQILNRSWGAA